MTKLVEMIEAVTFPNVPALAPEPYTKGSNI
jgi:hypothetical protein